MSFKCSVISCNSKSDKRTKNPVSFFEFPSTPTRKQTWLESIGRPSLKPLRSSRVCSNHFDEKYFTRINSQVVLKSDAVPISLISEQRVAPRLILNSSRSSEENILSNTNKRGPITSTSEVQQIGMKRPRRNTVYMGSYKLSRTYGVATPPSQITSTPPLAKNQSGMEKQFANELEPVTRRQRNTTEVGPNDVEFRAPVAKDARRTNRLSKEPKKTTPTLPKNRAPIEPTKTPPLNNQYSGSVIRRQYDAVVNDMSYLSILKLLIGKSPQSTNSVSKVTKKTATTLSRNQSSIHQYFPKKITSASKVVNVEPEEAKLEDCIFGWSEMGPFAVPFIMQNSEKFCALRMFEKTLVAYKEQKLIIGQCGSNVECFSTTRAQCELLNEINVQHCDSAFGKENFSMKDKLVRLKDAHKYFTFVDLCHEPFMKGIRVQSEGLEFGFTAVNRKSYIPHIIRKERKFIPLSYVRCDDDIFDILKEKVEKVSGRDALFLKFCCKFDGNSDIENDGCIEIIELLDLQRLAPPDTKFKDCWPSTGENYQLRVVATVKGLSLEFVKRNGLLR